MAKRMKIPNSNPDPWPCRKLTLKLRRQSGLTTLESRLPRMELSLDFGAKLPISVAAPPVQFACNQVKVARKSSVVALLCREKTC